MNVYVNATCTEIETKERAWMNVYVNGLCKCYMHWNRNKQKRKELESMFM
jgi:hypothetical protein